MQSDSAFDKPRSDLILNFFEFFNRKENKKAFKVLYLHLERLNFISQYWFKPLVK